MTTNLDALEILTETITQKKMRCGLDIFLGIDLAASHFYRGGQYTIKDKSHALRQNEYLEFLEAITKIIRYWCLKILLLKTTGTGGKR